MRGAETAAQKSTDKSVVKSADAKSGDAKAAAKTTPEHVAYAESLWKYITHPKSPYSKWTTAKTTIDVATAPPATKGSVTYVNKIAAADSLASVSRKAVASAAP